MPSHIKTSTYDLIFPKKIDWTSNQLELYRKIIFFVNQLGNFQSPKIGLEQYSLPSDMIALILILATKDLKGKNVVDIGCGTGRFTLAIQKFFSNRILGVDVDPEAIERLIHLRTQHKLMVDLLISSVEFLETFNWGRKFQTTLMNPPFGTKRRKIDFIFLKQALTFSQTIISIHKSNQKTRDLITRLGKQYGKKMELLATLSFPIFPRFQFHHKKRHLVHVDLLCLNER